MTRRLAVHELIPSNSIRHEQDHSTAPEQRQPTRQVRSEQSSSSLCRNAVVGARTGAASAREGIGGVLQAESELEPASVS